MEPFDTSQNREIRLMIVVLPLPDGPTSAVVVPGFTEKETSCNTGTFFS